MWGKGEQPAAGVQEKSRGVCVCRGGEGVVGEQPAAEVLVEQSATGSQHWAG